MIRPLAIAVSISGMLVSSPAMACRCKEPSDREAVARAPAAIVGKVISITQVGPNSFDHEVMVDRAWGDVRTGRTTVRSQGMCRFEMKPDSTYLLFLQSTPPGILQTSVCMGNRTGAAMAAPVELLEKKFKASLKNTTERPEPQAGAGTPCG